MKRNEIKRTIEEVIRVEYIAEDGQIFYNEDECKKYERSALFAISRELKRLNTKSISMVDLIGEGVEDEEVEIFYVQTDRDLEILRRYLYLKAIKNGASESSIRECFISEDGSRNNYVFHNVTKGHEVIIHWSSYGDWFWVYGDGSIDGYLSYLKENMLKLITTDNITEE